MATKSLNDRVDKAVDIVNEAREALDGARLQGEEIAAATKKLSKVADRLRKLLKDVGEIADDIEEALGAIDSELESMQDLKLEAHVDALETAAEVLDDVSQLEL
jgi:ABC-type transporter Mla subunit MlaD